MVPPLPKSSVASQSDVLLAVLGMSPAVLTETVWALAHEDPATIPDHVVVLTTCPGRDELIRMLFENDGWHQLREALGRAKSNVRGRLRFGPAGDHIRVFPKPGGSGDLNDIVTREDSQEAADFIMRCLREFTEDSGTRVIASIAGGRKTMGALLTSCMVLLGRKNDRLCHVLVSPPYDRPDLNPRFIFPKPGLIHRLPELPSKIASKQARIELTDIPFVRVRGWYEKEHGCPPPSYMSLVRLVQGLSPKESDYPEIAIDMPTGRLWIDKCELHLSSAEFALFAILAGRIAAGRPIQSWATIEEDIRQLQAMKNIPAETMWLHDFSERRFDLKEDARKLASGIRKKLAPVLRDKALLGQLVPSLKAKGGAIYPARKIAIRGLTDVS